MKNKLSRSWRGLLVDLLLVGGAAAMTVGAGCIYPPAGWIVGGLLAMAGAFLASGEKDGGEQ